MKNVTLILLRNPLEAAKIPEILAVEGLKVKKYSWINEKRNI
jgi:hypothetical protein